jgi:hypothetical protein
MLIAYCEKCGFRVPDEELSAGTAVKVSENNYLCSKCAPPKKSGKPGDSRIGPGYKPAAAKSSRIPAVTPMAAPAASPSHAPVHAAKAARKQEASPLPYIIGGGGLVALVLAVMLVSAGGKTTPVEKTEGATSPKQTPVATESPSFHRKPIRHRRLS